MLKSNSKEFKNRVARFVASCLPYDTTTAHYTDGERAYKWKKSIIEKYGAFTPATVKNRVNCGGGFFYGALEMVEILAGFFGENADERKKYFERWTREYFKTDNDEYIINFYSLMIYRGIESLVKGVNELPEIDILSGVLGLIEERKEGRGAFPWREYVYIIVDGVKVAGYSLQGVHVPPAYRDLQAQRVNLIFKNGKPYKLEKGA